MKLLEIKNNLVKLSYAETENPILGRFIILGSNEKSYVAQFVNLKSDTINNYAIAKLLFTFTPDGVVDNYDGSVPNMDSELSFLAAEELLNLLPIETPVKIGNLAQQDEMLSLDISVFERNFTIFVEKDSNKKTFISNCVRQLFQMKEKSVIVDTCNLFEDYPKIVFSRDFKLPLNSKMIDYIFEYELAEVDAPTKAVIQDIFYAVQQYIDTLDFKFLPIDNFVDVVANQYKDIQMPELALLKNKLLKYRDANVFANTKEEVLAFKERLNEKNCSIIDIKDINEPLQKEVMSFIHQALTEYEKYIYFFAPLTDNNSDKKLLKQFINNNHVFTTILVSSSYKYAQELKQHAQNILLFTPNDMNHDFAAYNTFLNKLNSDECIAFGKLTQGIPFIIDMSDLDLDLTLEDVLGDKYQFVPISDNMQLVKTDEYGNKTPVNLAPELIQDDVVQSTQEEQTLEYAPMQEEISDFSQEETVIDEEIPQIEESGIIDEPAIELPQESVEDNNKNIVEPVSNILDDESISEEDQGLTEDDLELDPLPEQEDLQSFDEEDLTDEPLDEDSTALTEDDLNFIDDNQIAQPSSMYEEQEPEITDDYQESPYIEEQTPVVPVYPAEQEPTEESGDFQQGDSVTHPRYGRGVVEKIIKYGNKTLCSISFENVGRRLLDPTISELKKL
ncbi:MAG: hypothetical protein DK841_08995 [Candidatus Melainabacteria bacterium]|nr:MAG: hypothetical protein DK841_08995 [Candidatus Melainabacteria bacterium]